MTITEAIITAIVEGLTEFLPVSSTGHMIITEHLLGTATTETERSFTNLFTVVIQLGAILAVVVLYHKKFFQFNRWQFYAKLVVGVIPALILGYLFADKIDELLFNPTTVAVNDVKRGRGCRHRLAGTISLSSLTGEFVLGEMRCRAGH